MLSFLYAQMSAALIDLPLYLTSMFVSSVLLVRSRSATSAILAGSRSHDILVLESEART